MSDADAQRAAQAERWESSAAGWGRQADAVRAIGMPVSVWMIDHLGLAPGQRALELAAGPGDTGFLAAELLAPGTLVSSDASPAMLEVARGRAEAQGVANVAFAERQLEWIDEPTASFDAVLCRWGLMFCIDPAAALAECRRVLRPGGRLALAVWDVPGANPWLTVPTAAVEAVEAEAGTQAAEGPSPPAPGPGAFALADAERLEELVAGAGFLDVVVEPVAITHDHADVEDWLEETLDSSYRFATAWRGFDAGQRAALLEAVTREADAFRGLDGRLRVPGRCLCAAAEA